MRDISKTDEPSVLGSKQPRQTPASFKLASPEQIANMREVGRLKRAANKALKLRRDFLDAGEWERLAHERKVRLPGWDIPITLKGIRAWSKKVGWLLDDYRTWEGNKDLEHFARANPGWGLRALAGLMLEATA